MMQHGKHYKFRTVSALKTVDGSQWVGYTFISPNYEAFTMLDFAILFIPAFLVMIVMKVQYDHDITTKELSIHFAAVIIGAAVVLGINYFFIYNNIQDTEVLNGSVTGKYKHTEYCSGMSSCKHYHYVEHCRKYTDSKGHRKKSCTDEKVYDYPTEYDWYVQTTVGRIEIERVNRRGDEMPDRYRVAQIGEPASAPHSYYNYLFADEKSLFAPDDFETKYPDDYRKGIPSYPLVYDYYRTNHIINLTNINSSGYNEYLSEVLSQFGKEKELNITVVMYKDNDPQFVDATMSKWRGGKKNDVIMFFGVDGDGNVTKFYSTSFAGGMKNEMLHATLRIDALSEKMSLDLLQKQVHTTVQEFVRLPNEEFKYMKYRLEPKLEIIVACSIVLLVLSIFVGLYMRNNDL